MGAFGRILTAMVTPFDKNLEVDYARAAELAKHLVANGSDGLVVAGTTGEAATLTYEERIKLFAAVLDAVGDKAYVIGGTGTNDTATTIKISQAAAREGMHGVMLVAPYYNKPSQEGIYQHFAATAEKIDLPIIAYNVPGRTNVNITPENVLRLAKIPNIAAIKEASGNLDQMAEIISQMPDDFYLYSGDDALTLPIMSIGGYGIISVASHVVGPQMKQMIYSFLAGEVEQAKKQHLSLLPVFKAMFISTNPTAVKAALSLTGFEVGGVRLPLVTPMPGEIDKIKKALADYGLN